MSDQKRWFKLWHSALSDDALQALPPAHRWAWAALGAHIKVHGERGEVKINPKNASLAAAMGVDIERMKDVISVLPNVHLGSENCANGEFTVTWQNWRRFQEDSTVSERVSRLRSKRRGEEKRGEENKTTLADGGKNGSKTTKKEEPKKERGDTPIQAVVKCWKMLNNIPTEGPESAAWDKVHFARHAKSAQSLLALFGNWEEAVDAMEFVFNKLTERKLTCTIETTVKHSDLYREYKEGRNQR